MDTSKIKEKLNKEGSYWSFIRYTMAEILDVWPLGSRLNADISKKFAKNTELDAKITFDEEGVLIEATKDDKKFSERLDLNSLEITDEGWNLIETEYKKVLSNLNEWKGANDVKTGTPTDRVTLSE